MSKPPPRSGETHGPVWAIRARKHRGQLPPRQQATPSEPSKARCKSGQVSAAGVNPTAGGSTRSMVGIPRGVAPKTLSTPCGGRGAFWWMNRGVVVFAFARDGLT